MRGGEGTFGALLRRYRRRAGFSQEELAARSYVSVRAVSDLERGVNALPRLHTAIALADGLGLQGAERRAFERHARPSEDDGEPAGEPLAVPSRARPPLTLDAFVDDGSRVDAVLSLVADRSNRVVSLTGPGGVGKTRLALEVAARLEGPVAYVAARVPRRPGTAGGGDRRRARCRSRSDTDPLASLVDHVGSHRLTLVLDNLEQLVDAAGDVATVVRSCPGREHRDDDTRPAADHGRGALRCRTAGDVRRSAGRTAGRAAVPRSCGDVGLRCARVVGPDELEDVAELCARLDGVPLAIELAAAVLAGARRDPYRPAASECFVRGSPARNTRMGTSRPAMRLGQRKTPVPTRNADTAG